MRGVTKRFPGVVANDHIDLQAEPGQVLALLGENGAGKSTLMNVLYGLYTPDEGEILLNGQPVQFSGPRDAIAHRIGMVHQHFMLVPPLTVAENIMLGDESVRGPFLDRATVEQRIEALSHSFGLDVDPRARVADLPVGVQQRVEIIKALYRGADVLILDEPTAVLTPQETDELLRSMRGLADEGKTIIFITHKLREVLQVADCITVLRLGKVAGSVSPAAATEATLAAMMVGRPVVLRIEKRPAQPGSVVLAIADLVVRGDRHNLAVNGLSLDVRAGEIVAIAGVEGNGQQELVEALSGLRRAQSGRVQLAGRDVTNAAPRKLIEAGLAHIPADRQRYGLVLSQPISENLVLSTYYRPPFARGLLRSFAAIWQQAQTLIRAFDIRAPSPATPAGALSGGNQQKTVAARELSRRNLLLIAAQPTRGLDVGSMEFIHRRIVETRDGGAGVLLISTELDEILALADRIAVIFKGAIVATVDAAEADAEQLGLFMTGGADAQP
jgi:simple sugar transport system ATP-binding protein